MGGENVGIQIFGPVPGALVDTDPGRFVVFVRENWGDDWQACAHLQPLHGFNRLAPQMSEAKFKWEYGRILETDAAAFAVRDPKDLAGWYVRVDNLYSGGSIPRWYGRFEDEDLDVHGADEYPQGDQTLKAGGLELDLDRFRISTVKCWQNSATISQETVPAFNRKARRGPGLFGNRSTAVHTDDVYEFSADGQVWNAKQVADSLLAWNLPSGGVPFVLGGQADELAKLQQVWDFKPNTTLRQAFNTLVDPRRGLGWRIRVDEEDNAVIWIFSILDEPVSVGSETLAANTERFAVTLDDAQDVDEALVTLMRSSKYDRVRVQGAPIIGIGTIAFADSTMELAAAAALVTAYKSGASAAPGYSALSSLEKAQLNDQYRGADRFDRLGVFRIPVAWDRTVGDGEGGDKYVLIPTIDDDGELDFDTAQPLFLLGKAFLHHLPAMEVGKDYSVDPPTNPNPSDADPEFRRPFVLLKYGGKYMYADKLPESIDQTGVPSATVRMLDRELALAVDMKPRFLLFNNHWTSAEPGLLGGRLFDSTLVFDYDDMLATVALEGDQPVRIVAGGGAGGDLGRELLVEVPDARLVYIAPGTIVDVDDNGNPKRTPGGILLVDDRDRLRAIAAISWAWYGKARATVRLTIRSRFPLIQPGQVMMGVRSASDFREVGTVVSEEYIDFEKGSVRYTTMWANVNFAGLAPGIPDRRALVQEVQAVKKALQEVNERTGGLPARIGSAMVLAAATLIGISGYAEADAASPDAFKTSSSNFDFYSRSITDDAWSDSKRLILKLAQPFIKAENQSWFLVLSNVLESYCQYDLASPEGGMLVYMDIRVQSILEDFDLETQTSWNALAGLSIGSPQDSHITIGGGTTGGVGTSIDNMKATGGLAPTLLYSANSRISAGATIYGFVIDVKPRYDGGVFSIASQEAYLRVRSTWDGVTGIMYIGGTPYRAFLALSQQ